MVVRRRQINVQKSLHVQNVFWKSKPIALFYRSRCRCRRKGELKQLAYGALEFNSRTIHQH